MSEVSPASQFSAAQGLIERHRSRVTQSLDVIRTGLTSGDVNTWVNRTNNVREQFTRHLAETSAAAGAVVDGEARQAYELLTDGQRAIAHGKLVHVERSNKLSMSSAEAATELEFSFRSAPEAVRTTLDHHVLHQMKAWIKREPNSDHSAWLSVASEASRPLLALVLDDETYSRVRSAAEHDMSGAIAKRLEGVAQRDPEAAALMHASVDPIVLANGLQSNSLGFSELGRADLSATSPFLQQALQGFGRQITAVPDR